MKLAGLFVLATAICLAQVRNPHTTPDDVTAGGRIFRSHCADCHGLHGRGGKGPDLTAGAYYHGSTDADLLRNVSDGIPGTAMPGVFFSPDQVWQIVAYVRSLSEGSGSVQAPPGDLTRGQKLFASKGCGGCHLVRGSGGANGPDLTYIGSQRHTEFLRASILDPSAVVDQAFWTADIILEDGAAYKGFVLNQDTYHVQMLHPKGGLLTLPKRDFRKFEIRKTSTMPPFQGKLREAELNDLVAYLWSLQRPRRVAE